MHAPAPEEPVITILLCQVAPAGADIAAGMHWNAWISITPHNREVVTIDPDIRPSRETLTIAPSGWSWRDNLDGVEGAVSVNRASLRYEADYGGRRYVGQCRDQADEDE